MSTQNLPVNRTAVGLIALGCLTLGAGLYFVVSWLPDSSSVVFLQGALIRVGLLMGAVWLALPGRHQAAAWANISPRTVVGLLLAVIVTARIQLRILIPVAVVIGVILVLLRPRSKRRPSA